ncbi:MAG: rRNA pseudouridine synthase [Nitrospirae bacterium]|nr:rRNA pseudouridine synthase [Nitrospirota bacterium]
MKPATKKVSLARALSKLGVVSRNQARGWIEAGRVSVNGRSLKNPEVRVDPDRESIRVDGRIIRAKTPVYLMMHKPKGVMTTRSDERGRKTVYDLLERTDWIFPVGRLDRGTSGLLLLTNDTQWGNRIVAPESKIPRLYHAKLNRPIATEDLLRLSKGVDLDDHVKTRPAQARLLRLTEKGCWIELTLMEGKNRQVRRMCESVGYRVENLIRVRIGDLGLGDLPAGATRPLTPVEVRSLGRKQAEISRSRTVPASLRQTRSSGRFRERS